MSGPHKHKTQTYDFSGLKLPLKPNAEKMSPSNCPPAICKLTLFISIARITSEFQSLRAGREILARLNPPNTSIAAEITKTEFG